MKQQEMSLYVHIPFCVKKCNYCDFLSFPANDSVKEQYVQALCQEIESLFCVKGSAKEQLGAVPTSKKQNLKTIFFGGGTPSVLEGKQMERIMDSIKKTFTIMPNAEVTIEMNPGSITREKLEQYKKIGINRLSIGLQTTNDERLKILGRVHTFEQFLQNYEMARHVGFTNISVDLMSALPKEDLKDYKKDLERILALKPEHISSYSLIIEEGTPFYDNNEVLNHLPSEEEDRKMYELTEQMLLQEGYHRYEISNYAKAGKESQHNSVYWTGGNYLGVGLGASSYLKLDTPYWKPDKEESDCFGIRFKNETKLTHYLKQPYKPILEREEVTKISKQEAMEEFMFLGLRMMKGVNMSEFYEKFQVELEEVYGEVIQKFVDMGFLEKEEDNIRFTKQGIDVSNSILCEFLQD